MSGNRAGLSGKSCLVSLPAVYIHYERLGVYKTTAAPTINAHLPRGGSEMGATIPVRSDGCIRSCSFGSFTYTSSAQVYVNGGTHLGISIFGGFYVFSAYECLP